MRYNNGNAVIRRNSYAQRNRTVHGRLKLVLNRQLSFDDYPAGSDLLRSSISSASVRRRSRRRKTTKWRNALTVGDEVTTIGGIIGKVVSIKDETCVIATSHDNTKIRILKSAISRVDVKAEDAVD